jgi:NAD+ synthase (glutamine-hydrolysing)
MKLVKVGAAVVNQTPRDWEGNFANIVEAIRQAREQGVTVLCLPEATITGYGLEDDLFCADVPRRAMLRLAQIETYTRGMIVCVGLPILFNNTLYNRPVASHASNILRVMEFTMSLVTTSRGRVVLFRPSKSLT